VKTLLLTEASGGGPAGLQKKKMFAAGSGKREREVTSCKNTRHLQMAAPKFWKGHWRRYLERLEEEEENGTGGISSVYPTISSRGRTKRHY